MVHLDLDPSAAIERDAPTDEGQRNTPATADTASYASGATALMFGAISLGMLRSKALPSWLAYLGLVLAVASFAVAPLGLLAFGLWVLVTSIVLLVTAKKPAVTAS